MEYFRQNSSQLMLLLGVSLLIAILLRRSFRYFRRSRSQNSSPIVKIPRPSQISSTLLASKSTQRWQVEMFDIARDLKAELDSKMGAIQHLTRLAGEQADRLEAAIERAEELAKPSASGFSHRIDGISFAVPPNPHEQPESNYFRQTILAFSEQGYTPEQIAQQVDLSLAEVLTILESSEDDFAAS